MLYELRTYTLKPGTQATVAKNASTVSRDIRGDEYGKLVGYWMSELGPLNQVLHMWSYESYEERTELRKALGANPRWQNEYLPLIRPNLVLQEVRLMDGFLPITPPASEGNVYEFRAYRTQAGRAREWAKRFADVMPVRMPIAPVVGAWVTETPQPNEVCHLAVYPSLDARFEMRRELWKQDGWLEFLGQAGPLLEAQHSTVLLPAEHSPLR